MSKLQVERWALCGVFFIHGAVFASWAGRIAQVQQSLGLNNGQLGMCLLAMAVGAFIAMPASGALGHKFGTSRVTALASITYCLTLPFIAAASSQAGLAFVLFCFGFFQGCMDVSMNAHAVVLERQFKDPIMSTFHALFSVGAMTGGALAGASVSAGLTTFRHFVTFAALCLPIILVIASQLREPAGEQAHASGPMFVLPDKRLAALGVICFCTFIGEGAVADWSSVYLSRTLAAPPAVAALGFAVFSATMAIFRFLGDPLMKRFGTHRMVFAGGLIAGLGLGVTLLMPPYMVALACYAVAGMGFACLVPAVFSAAGRAATSSASLAIAGVATAGYFGFVIAPPAIGGLADLITLRWALLLTVFLCLIVVVLSGAAKVSEQT